MFSLHFKDKRCTLKLVQNQMVDAGKNHNGSKINGKEMAGFDHRC